MSSNSWTNEEEEFLRDNVINMTINELALALNKTIGQVKGKKERMGLFGIKLQKPISYEEKLIIKEYYEQNHNNLSLNELAEKLGRSKHLICRKAKEMGLTGLQKKKRKTNAARTNLGSEIIGKSNEEFLSEVCSLVEDEYTFCEEYRGSAIPIKVRHNVCGNEYLIRPNNFLRGNRCPICRTARKTTDQFKEDVLALTGQEYIVVGEYMGSDELILLKHTKCNKEFKITPHHFKQGARCEHCRKEVMSQKKKKLNDVFLKQINDLHGNIYVPLEEYKGCDSKILFKHNVPSCGKAFYVSPHVILNKNNLYKCDCSRIKYFATKTHEQFLEDVFDLFENEYTVISRYIKSSIPIEVKHNVCGQTFTVYPSTLIHGWLGSKCTICNAINKRLRVAGKNNPNWKGGISALRRYLYINLTEWRNDSIKNCNYKCVITNGRFDDVHHPYSFNLIIDETLINCNLPLKDDISKYSQEELELLLSECIKLHYKYGLGICINKEYHKLFHQMYGYGNNVPEDFEEFKEYIKSL